LPAPWNSEGAAAASNGDEQGLIEFGELDGGGAWELAKPQAADESDGEDGEDEMPASIPMATARPGRLLEAVLDTEDFETKFDATEDLLESFSEFDHLEIRADDPAPAEQDPPAAKNPFAEPFDEEEIVLDPYTAFEADLLRTAPLVFNRLDRAFASELHRCVQRAIGNASAAAATVKETVAGPPGGECQAAAGAGCSSDGGRGTAGDRGRRRVGRGGDHPGEAVPAAVQRAGSKRSARVVAPIGRTAPLRVG
jgi:hypothetical protein